METTTKLNKNNKMKEENKDTIGELTVQTLEEALKGMKIGESRYAPSCMSGYTVKVVCSKLKKEGYWFTTSGVDGRRLVTRVK